MVYMIQWDYLDSVGVLNLSKRFVNKAFRNQTYNFRGWKKTHNQLVISALLITAFDNISITGLLTFYIYEYKFFILFRQSLY